MSCFTRFKVLLVSVSFFLILSLSCPFFVFSKEYFSDDFTNEDIDARWTYVLGNKDFGNSWWVEGGVLVSEIGNNGSSFLYTKQGEDVVSCSVSLDLVNYSGVDQSVTFNVLDDFSKYYMVDFRYSDPFWPQDGNNIRLWRFDGRYVLLKSVFPRDFGDVFRMDQNVLHHARIDYQPGKIVVFFDSIKVIEFLMSPEGSFVSTKTGLRSWGGDYSGVVKNTFDNYLVFDDVVEESRNKLIIVPGLGASWNSRAMVYNENVDPKDWKMTPFVKNYDDLKLALEDKGLVEDKDFFVWNYDWRKSLDEITEKLDDFVDEVAPGEEVDMLGHSLGALVTRVWAQKNESKAGKIIGLGGPQEGALNAYDAWNGAKVSDKFDIRSIALNILLQLQKKNKETKVETIRAYSPILKDLLPIFDFAKMGTRVLSFAGLESKNDYLMGKNSTVASLFGKLEEMVSVGEKTKEWIVLKPRSIFEETLGLWPDGVPTKYLYGEGDGTVLKKSAKFEGDSFVEIAGKHGEMVGDLLDEIFDKLDLGTVGISVEKVPDLSASTVFFVGSPVKMSLNCEGDVYTEDEGFVLIEGDKYEKCDANLTAVESGTYHLVSGRVDKEDWRYFEGEVEKGEVLVFEVKADDGSLLLDGPASEDYLFGLIKRDIGLLKEEFGENGNLVQAEEAAESKNLNLLTDAIFGFRKEQKEMTISERILGNLKLLLIKKNEGVSSATAMALYRKALSAKSLLDRRVRLLTRRRWKPTFFGARSDEMMEEETGKMRSNLVLNKYKEVATEADLIMRLAKEVL